MKKSKLIILLQSLSSKELKELNLYIQSPLFNKNKDVLNLLSILNKYHPTFPDKKINHEALLQSGTKTLSVQKLRYVMTDLTKLVEQFLSMKQAQEQEQMHLIRALQKRGIDKYFKKEVKQQQLRIQASAYRDEHHYKHLHDLSECAFHHTLEHDNRNIDSQLQEVVDNLDTYYLTKKLKYSCEIINRMNILNVDYDIKLLENLIEYLNQQNLQDRPAVNTYFHVLKTLNQPNDERNYIQLKALVQHHLMLFQRDDQYDLYGYLQNYCIKKINSGNNMYLSELFSNYKEMIAENVVLKDGRISQFDFKNIVTVALRMKDFKWTETFITNHQIYLPEEHANNAIAFNKARLYFSQKEYKKSRRELLSVEFTDIFYSLDYRALLLKTYYEMEDFESALNLTKAFKAYLKRDKKISSYQNKTYSSFLNITNKLTRYKLGYNVPKADILKDINQAEQVADLSWLKSQVEGLN